ncbi:MTHFR-domain-containing protein [Heliocybe sulcata]|uniref:MTHFR-domain-containing protein n=1 Tax=Heliocybe sulcata TaxID=5364 RepID=A0A5C3NA97_9AGAM|nr:MTHFR-domain-containing protein [Heliocybe sulcata]
MKLTEKIAAYQLKRPFYTFEFFPPKTDEGFENLLSRVVRLASLSPLAVSVTWGAGGSTKDRSLELAGLIQNEEKIDTILHLTCTNMEGGMVDDALIAAKERGIQNILALRGDPPRGEEYWIPTDPRFTHGVDLVSYIRSSAEFSSSFSVGVAAYPDGHADHDTDEDGELDYLKAKVDAGADFIMTQLFYDCDNFLRWLKKVRDRGITVPVIPSIMPLQTYASFLRLTKLCGSRVPDAVASALEPIRHDDAQVKEYGIALAIDMVQRLTASGDVAGLHFCTLNLEKSVRRVIEGLGWAGGSPQIRNKLIADVPDSTGSADPESTMIITPTSASNSATKGLIDSTSLPPDAGRGEKNNASSWDEYPNGRFGDFKSPAFGEQDQWGGPVITRGEALAKWGDPKTVEDLTEIFLRHLRGEIDSTPFSHGPLSPESILILKELEKLNKRGWWTVGSQPAVDGIRSTDEVFGWGPPSGYVYQKAFVEFFATGEDVEKIEKKIAENGDGWVDYFAGNFEGECRSNVPDGGRNAVTWGVFPGQEVLQTTIIERESFLSWKEEAFSILSEWASFYAPGSEQRKLLKDIRDQRWLVSIVHHDYKDASALWTFLGGQNGLV